MEPRVQIDFEACFFLAVGLLVLPWKWLLGAAAAAAVHEFCHYAAAWTLGIRCLGLRISAGGMRMTLSPMSPREELLIAAAGPMGSLLLLGLIHVFPQMAVCGGVQGIFNLLPIWPLDGGRILSSLLYHQPGLQKGIEIAAAVLLTAAGVWIQVHLNMGIWPVLLAGIVTAKAFLRKIPCNAEELGVQ